MFARHHNFILLVNSFKQFDHETVSGRLGESRFSLSVTLTRSVSPMKTGLMNRSRSYP